MQIVTYSRSDLVTLMLNDAGINVDEVEHWYSDADGGIVVEIKQPARATPDATT